MLKKVGRRGGSKGSCKRGRGILDVMARRGCGALLDGKEKGGRPGRTELEEGDSKMKLFCKHLRDESEKSKKRNRDDDDAMKG